MKKGITYISDANLANLMGVSKATVERWRMRGDCIPDCLQGGKYLFNMDALRKYPPIAQMLDSQWEDELRTTSLRYYTSIELFAGAGGLALGMERAGFRHVLLSELNPDACRTLKNNRPNWNVVEGDVCSIDFSPYYGKVDLITGGFPCQAFSYAGKHGGFDDTRGTLFFELLRAVREVRPRVFMAENVKGLLSHNGGNTLRTIRRAIEAEGYTLIEPEVLQAMMYQVPQKRDRLIFVAIRNDLVERAKFAWPQPYHRVVTLRDAFCAGELYLYDVPPSLGAQYPPKKKDVLALVPMGGDWRDLPLDKQQEYLGGSFHLPGGKTGMARRLSWDEPSLTLTCSPAQKQTERCHPEETRPLSVREYARIQTFPDEWDFAGGLSSQYKQIGNAVPVNLAWAMGRALIRLLNTIEGGTD